MGLGTQIRIWPAFRANISAFGLLLSSDVSMETVKEERHWRNRPGYPDVTVLPLPRDSHINLIKHYSLSLWKILQRPGEALVLFKLVVETSDGSILYWKRFYLKAPLYPLALCWLFIGKLPIFLPAGWQGTPVSSQQPFQWWSAQLPRAL